MTTPRLITILIFTAVLSSIIVRVFNEIIYQIQKRRYSIRETSSQTDCGATTYEKPEINTDECSGCGHSLVDAHRLMPSGRYYCVKCDCLLAAR